MRRILISLYLKKVPMTHSTLASHAIPIVWCIRMGKYAQAHAGGPISQKVLSGFENWNYSIREECGELMVSIL